ncbi:MAG: acyltransferase [Bacteroidaceae bacterium]|nr:acyltransferase [Bacteroidaceae bacterium]MEA5017692.1 acyltransferase [Erysipelotrichaceae bacterium]
MLLKIIIAIRKRIANPYKRAIIVSKQGVKMGVNCQVFPNVSFGSEPYLIQIGNNVKITDGCTFITHDGGIEVIRNLKSLSNADLFGTIRVGNNVFFGNRCIIMPNVEIGDNVIIGAGSVVTKSILPNSVVVGVPARVIKSIDEYYDKVEQNIDFTKNLTLKDKREYLIEKYNLK